MLSASLSNNQVPAGLSGQLGGKWRTEVCTCVVARILLKPNCWRVSLVLVSLSNKYKETVIDAYIYIIIYIINRVAYTLTSIGQRSSKNKVFVIYLSLSLSLSLTV